MSKAPNNDGEVPAEGGFGAAAYERPVPRIAIEAFSEFPDTIAALQKAATDRRLSKAHMGVQSGNIATAVKHFGDHPTPNLLIVETRGQGQAVLSELEQLANALLEPLFPVAKGVRLLGISLSSLVAEEAEREGEFSLSL